MMDKIDILAELGEAVYMFTERASAEGKYLIYEEPPMLSPVLGDIIFAFGRIQMIRINGSNPKKLMVLVLSTMVSFF